MLRDLQVKKLPELLDFYHNQWDDALFLKNKEDPEVWKLKGANIISAFHNKFSPKAQEVLVTEDYFKTPLGDHELSGVIDRLDRIMDNAGEPILEIIDYKTGKMQSQKYIHDNIQLTFYYHAIRSRFPDIKDIRLTLYFLEPGVKQSTYRDSGHVERMQEEVFSTISKIEQGEFEPTINNLCPWCDFKEICPLYEREASKRGWPKPDMDWQKILRTSPAFAKATTLRPSGYGAAQVAGKQATNGPSQIAVKAENLPIDKDKISTKNSTGTSQTRLF
jgi:CRISPR/Cas system-associated exonuclease Cas4 (RecB family)